MNITTHNLTFTYPSGVQALRGIDLELPGGQSVAIIGENGAGKTTLVKHFNGLLKPGDGRVLVGDWDTHQHSVAKLAARVGYVFQNPDDQLFARRVRDEIAFGPRNLGCSAEETERWVEAALTQTGLQEVANVHPYDLPISQRKLVAIAAVLAMHTPAIIFDEPTIGQDGAGAARIGGLIAGLRAEGRSVTTISHDIDFVAAHCERVIVMADGQVLADGPTADILSQESLLHQAGVAPPQLIRLAAALGLDGAPLTVEAFIAALR